MKEKDIKLKAIFIDFDGTLVNSAEDMYCIYCDFLKHYGCKGTKKEFQELNGPSLTEIVDILISRHKLPEPSEKLLAFYWTLLTEYYAEIAEPYRGVTDFLDKCHKLGIKQYLVTSATPNFLDPFLKKYNLEKYFDAIITSEGLKKSKPDPAIYQLALNTAQIRPNEAVAIEDSLNGVESALKAGVFTLRINPSLHKPRHHEEWMELKGWKEIMDYIGNCYG